MAIQPKSISEAKKLGVFFWLTFIFALFMFVFMAFLITEQRVPADNPVVSISPQLIIMSILALVSFGWAVYIRRKIPNSFIKKTVKRMARKSSESGDGLKQPLAASSVLTITLIIAACLEACGIYGLILVLFGAEFSMIFPFAFLAFMGFIILWPTDDFVSKITRMVNGVEVPQDMTNSGVIKKEKKLIIVAFLCVILWIIIYVGVGAAISLILPNEYPFDFMTKVLLSISMLFSGILAWFFQRLGGILLILCGAPWLLVLTRTDDLTFPFVLIPCAMAALLVISGVLFIIDFYRKKKMSMC